MCCRWSQFDPSKKLRFLGNLGSKFAKHHLLPTPEASFSDPENPWSRILCAYQLHHFFFFFPLESEVFRTGLINAQDQA